MATFSKAFRQFGFKRGGDVKEGRSYFSEYYNVMVTVEPHHFPGEEGKKFVLSMTDGGEFIDSKLCEHPKKSTDVIDFLEKYKELY